MPLPNRTPLAGPIVGLLKRLRAGVGRSMRSAGSWVEGGDPVLLAGRLDKGEIAWRAFVDAGSAMRRCGRLAEAERMLARGLGAFPDDPTLLYEHALVAHNGGHYLVAIGRWERALRFVGSLPDDRAAMCRSGLAANLREIGQIDQAWAAIVEARRSYPHDLAVVTEAARIAQARTDLPEALAMWREAVASPAPLLEWLQGEIGVLVRLDRLDEADQALDLARARYPEAAGLNAAEGLIASARGDWPRAVAIWSDYNRQHPEDPAGRDQLAAALEAKGRMVASPAVVSAGTPPGELLRGFESIGEGCEFAMVQQRCGVAMPGLLGWSTLTFDALLSAIGQRFAGLGSTENSELLLMPDGSRALRDRRWPIDVPLARFHRSDREATFAEACQLVTTLRDRLLDDLAAAEKTFVYRSDGLDDDHLELLHRALAALGPVRLLAVQPAAPTAPTQFEGEAGEVIRVERNRFVGFLDRPSIGATDREAVDRQGVVTDWLALCRRAQAAA